MNVGRFGSGGGGRLDGAATTVWSSSSPCLGLLLSPLQAQLPMLRQATPLLLLQSYRSLGPAHVGVYAINTTKIAPFALSLPAKLSKEWLQPTKHIPLIRSCTRVNGDERNRTQEYHVPDTWCAWLNSPHLVQRKLIWIYQVYEMRAIN